MPVSSARPDSADSSYATRMLLNIFDSLLTLRERLEYRHICHVLISSHCRRRLRAKLARRQYPQRHPDLTTRTSAPRMTLHLSPPLTHYLISASPTPPLTSKSAPKH